MSKQAQVPLVDFAPKQKMKVRQQLEREIKNLERQLEQLKLGDDNINFSMLQTYKEMISARRSTLSHLPRGQL